MCPFSSRNPYWGLPVTAQTYLPFVGHLAHLCLGSLAFLCDGRLLGPSFTCIRGHGGAQHHSYSHAHTRLRLKDTAGELWASALKPRRQQSSSVGGFDAQAPMLCNCPVLTPLQDGPPHPPFSHHPGLSSAFQRGSWLVFLSKTSHMQCE